MKEYRLTKPPGQCRIITDEKNEFLPIDKNEIVIKNFLGEKIPRKTKLIEGVSVNIEGNMIIIKGIDKEKVGQMAGKIELLTKVRGRDKRVFQDGCYITDKNGKLVK